MKNLKRSFCVAAVLGLFILSALAAAAQVQAPKAQPPVLLTSCGQSPGPVMLKVILQKLGIKYEVNSLAGAADLQAKKEAGNPYKSIIIVMGASLKGMGAAGISIDEELKRVSEVIEEAKKEGVKIIGAHIEGMKRRSQGVAAGDTSDEQSIDAVAPKSDILVINKEGDSDGRFSKIASAGKIPIILVDKNLDLVAELGKVFAQ